MTQANTVRQKRTKRARHARLHSICNTPAANVLQAGASGNGAKAFEDIAEQSKNDPRGLVRLWTKNMASGIIKK
jgi:hypothetical protein